MQRHVRCELSPPKGAHAHGRVHGHPVYGTRGVAGGSSGTHVTREVCPWKRAKGKRNVCQQWKHDPRSGDTCAMVRWRTGAVTPLSGHDMVRPTMERHCYQEEQRAFRRPGGPGKAVDSKERGKSAAANRSESVTAAETNQSMAAAWHQAARHGSPTRDAPSHGMKACGTVPDRQSWAAQATRRAYSRRRMTPPTTGTASHLGRQCRTIPEW